MNNKLFKIGLGVASLGAVVAPLATVISCGDKYETLKFGSHSVKALNAGGYSSLMTKLASDDINIAGAWGDSRFYAGKNASKLHVVGVEKKRISNDGIQVRGDLKISDQIALQNLFIDLIQYSNVSTNNDLQIDFDGKDKSVFSIYSHGAYRKLISTDQVAIIDSDNPQGPLKNVNAGNGNDKIVSSSSFDATTSDYFSAAGTSSTTAKTKAALTTQYTTKASKKLNIVFIPSNDASKVRAATSKLNDFLTSIGVEAKIDVSTDYDTAASQLENKQYDVAFLPVETWIQNAPNTNFILQAARPTQVATMNVTGANAALPGINFPNEKDQVELFNKYGRLYLKDIKNIASTTISAADKEKDKKDLFKVEAAKTGTPEKKILDFANRATANDFLMGTYEAWLYTKKDSELDKLLADKYKTPSWTMPYKDVQDKLVFGYTSKTSGSSYLFPEMWFNEHFTK